MAITVLLPAAVPLGFLLLQPGYSAIRWCRIRDYQGMCKHGECTGLNWALDFAVPLDVLK